MKNAFVVLLFLVLANCVDEDALKTRQKVEIESIQNFNGKPKFKMTINLDSLKNTILNIDSLEVVYTVPHAVIYQQRRERWEAPIHKKLDSLNDNHRWRLFYSFQDFGKFSLTNENCKNQLGYQAFGIGKSVINEIDITLNLHTPYTKEKELLYFYEKIEEVMTVLKMEIPSDLKAIVSKGKYYYFENDLYYLMLLTHDKEYHMEKPIKYEEFTFIIKSK